MTGKRRPGRRAAANCRLAWRRAGSVDGVVARQQEAVPCSSQQQQRQGAWPSRVEGETQTQRRAAGRGLPLAGWHGRRRRGGGCGCGCVCVWEDGPGIHTVRSAAQRQGRGRGGHRRRRGRRSTAVAAEQDADAERVDRTRGASHDEATRATQQRRSMIARGPRTSTRRCPGRPPVHFMRLVTTVAALRGTGGHFSSASRHVGRRNGLPWPDGGAVALPDEMAKPRVDWAYSVDSRTRQCLAWPCTRPPASLARTPSQQPGQRRRPPAAGVLLV